MSEDTYVYDTYDETSSSPAVVNDVATLISRASRNWTS